MNSIITVKDGEKIVIISSKSVYMIRMENKQVIVYTKDEKYISNKRLYELKNALGNGFFRISKSTIVNIKKIDSIAPSFRGVMFIEMKNGCKDTISRKYLPEFKKYIGL